MPIHLCCLFLIISLYIKKHNFRYVTKAPTLLRTVTNGRKEEEQERRLIGRMYLWEIEFYVWLGA